MKLSEAAKLGIIHFPNQAIHNYFHNNGCCIVGAIWYGNFGTIKNMDLVEDLANIWPELFDDYIRETLDICDTCRDNPVLFNVLTCRNDNYGWTRERLIIWLEERGY